MIGISVFDFRVFLKLVAWFALNGKQVRTAEEIIAHMEYLYDLRDPETLKWGNTEAKANFEEMNNFLKNPHRLQIARKVVKFYKSGLQFMITELAQDHRLVEGWIAFNGTWQSLVERYGADKDSVKQAFSISFPWMEANSIKVYQSSININDNSVPTKAVYMNRKMPEHVYKVILTPFTIALCGKWGELIAIVDIAETSVGTIVHYTPVSSVLGYVWEKAKIPSYLREFGEENSYRLYTDEFETVLA